MQIADLNQHPDYASQTAQLLHSEWSHLPAWSHQPTILKRLTQQNQTASAEFTLIASPNGETVIATCSVIRYELDDIAAREYWIGEVVKDRKFRGQGVAKALIQQAIARAKHQQIGELWLYTPDQQAYYQRSGWRAVEQRQVADENVTVMMLHLAQ
ncbi:GNAT family N-acetyltransferase [Pantoea vagans]|uniref:GNAT family N-acetyltransferase n=1 Tax=Pantoea vagans TaxID=470934 RepID=UPI0023B0F919|nr:GNAT family N-acetyltransferase [Pantoea vagans]MDE8555081.1 GNAT family N-acetyltransferase [Pantoea vagans]MDE8575131.1 GNAT family N-acetyltransferase [Pantoea vagans]